MLVKGVTKGFRAKTYLAASVATICGCIFVSNANATPVTYTIDPGTGGTVSGTDGTFTETITGGFTIDFSTSTESNVSFTLTGDAGLAGTYVDTPALVAALQGDGLAGGKDACGLNGNNLVCLRFQDNLDGSVSPDPLFIIAGGLNGGSDLNAPAGFFDGSPTGSASVGSLAAVPEPASIALLGAALVGFGASRRRRRNAA